MKRSQTRHLVSKQSHTDCDHDLKMTHQLAMQFGIRIDREHYPSAELYHEDLIAAVVRHMLAPAPEPG